MYQTYPSSSLWIASIISCNMAVAFVNPNAISVHSHSPVVRRKAGFHWCPAATRMRLNPFFRHNLVNHLPPRVLSSSSLMTGSGYLSAMVRRLCALDSTTRLRDPSVLRTISMGAPIAKREGQTSPVVRFSSRYLCTHSSSSHVVL